MDYYNKEKIIRIRIDDFFKTDRIIFKKEIKFLGITLVREGFYYIFIGSTFLGKEIPKYHKLIKGDVFEVPEVVFSFQGGYSKKYYFDSYNEALMFANDHSNDHKWLKK